MLTNSCHCLPALSAAIPDYCKTKIPFTEIGMCAVQSKANKQTNKNQSPPQIDPWSCLWVLHKWIGVVFQAHVTVVKKAFRWMIGANPPAGDEVPLTLERCHERGAKVHYVLLPLATDGFPGTSSENHEAKSFHSLFCQWNWLACTVQPV